jgi:predicted histone-like DNA-binding protein
MPIKFKALPKRNPRDLEAAPMFYATSIISRKVDLDELSKAIARSSTVARADVYAVLLALIEEISDNLSNGNQVILGKLGSLAVNLRSDGAETAEVCNSSGIKGAKVIYRPGTEIKELLKILKYEKFN